MKQTWNTLAKARMSELEISQEKLGEMIGKTQGAIGHWLNGRREPSIDDIASILNALDLHEITIKSDGSASLNPSLELESIASNQRLKTQAGYFIEVLDVKASAGPGVINNDVIETVKLVEYTGDQANLMFGGRNPKNIKMITVSGDSMAGTIELGDSIFVDVSKNSFSGDGIYVFVFKNTLHVKRIQMMPDCLLVLSDNPKYKEWKITEETEQYLRISGKVLLSQSQAYKRHG
ncbi:LexA family transcriptional regulator [Limnobaculum xujianqingii]|uniref:LexA family transcriptional regulator n=1 Tax=Limnobaculum xujianqingii TaxID=2738837 RepID=UPI001E5F618F|nr:S24 family peptidase [Limnobaculum xujianqingii]